MLTEFKLLGLISDELAQVYADEKALKQRLKASRCYHYGYSSPPRLVVDTDNVKCRQALGDNTPTYPQLLIHLMTMLN